MWPRWERASEVIELLAALRHLPDLDPVTRECWRVAQYAHRGARPARRPLRPRIDPRLTRDLRRANAARQLRDERGRFTVA